MEGKNELRNGDEQLRSKLSIQIAFGPHTAESDVESIRDRFKTSDIYIPEAFRWSDSLLEQFNSVARGGITPTQLFLIQGIRRANNPYLYGQLELVANSSKQVVFIDYPEAKGKLKDFSEIFKPISKTDSFSDHLNKLKVSMGNMVRLQKEREDYMKSMLPIKIREVLAQNPELRKRDNLNVLICLGNDHIRLYEELKQEGYNIEKYVVPFSSHYDQAVRAYMSGEEISDELASKFFLENEFISIYKRTLNGVTDNLADQARLAYKITSQFNFEEAQEIFEAVKFGNGLSIFESKLKEKGIKLPKSGAQLEDFLAKPTPRPNSPESPAAQ